jgi:hypothetical protein
MQSAFERETQHLYRTAHMTVDRLVAAAISSG